jgi:acyl carrier protein
MNLESLENEIKKLVIETLELEDISTADIDSSEPLFIDGLGLDSIDALELGVALQIRYLIEFQTNEDDNKKHFESIETLAKFVNEQRKDRN